MAEDNIPVGGVREEPFYNFGDNIDIPLQINEQGNVILYRTTDSPDYLQVSNFTQKKTRDIGTLGFGQHTYFGPNIETPQAFWVNSTNRGLYKYDTNIKPNEIFIGNIGDKPELAKALGIPEQYWNMNYHRFLLETKDTYRKVLTDNIETFKQYGIKALGRYGGTSGPKAFEIIPLITNEDNLGVKAVAELEPIKGIGKGGAANWKVKEVITDTPTNVVDDFELSGTMGGNTNPKGTNIAYVDVEKIFPYVEFDRRINPKIKTDIDLIKQTILDKGYMYDTGQNSGVVFSMYVDSRGNIMMGEGNHRLRALYEVAQETGQKIYIPINLTPVLLDNVAEATKITDSYKVKNELNKLFKEFEEISGLQKGDTANWIITTGNKEGRIADKAVSYLTPGNNGLPQSSISRFLNAIGINAITYEELPDNSIYKTGVNTFTDTPDRPFGPGAAYIDEILNANTQLVNKLPLETVVKNRIKNLITTKTKQLAKPGSLLVKAVDAWEFGVIGLMAAGVAFNEIDEVPTIINNTAINMFNSMTAPYGIAPVEKEEYDIDYEFINTVLDTGSKVMPTDIIIEKLKPYSLEEGEDVILPGTGVTATTGAKQQFEPYGEELAKRAEKTVNMKRDEVKQKILESKGVQEEKMFEQAKPKKSNGGGSGAKIL